MEPDSVPFDPVVHLPFPVVLASASPRRRELLASLVPEFEALSPDVDEESHTVADPVATALELADRKSAAGQALRPGAVVIGGDTVVAIDLPTGPAQLAKPVDEADARRMLRLLSGRRHRVITGLSVRWPGGSERVATESVVEFRKLDDREIAEYVATGEPMDKAGAYAVQAGGGTFVARIEGSRTNVIGLPLEALEPILRRIALTAGAPETSSG